MSASDTSTPGFPASLRIRFGKGERPYVFWDSQWVQQDGDRALFKVLSKLRPDRSLEVLVVREGNTTRRKTLAHLRLPRSAPSGWLEHWVDTLATELGTRFEAFDLKNVVSQAEWREVAVRMGWSPGAADTP
jgi:hypothetical protein